MGFLGRLFGKKDQSQRRTDDAALPAGASGPEGNAQADPADQEAPGESRLSLQVLFPQPPTLDGEAFIKALARLHPSMARAALEAQNVDGSGQGIVAWGPHRIEMLIRKRPLPPQVAQRCIGPAHYRAEQKEQAKAHQAYVVLYHEANDVSPWGQYAALGAAAAAISRQQNAVAVANAFALTSAPVTLFDQLFKSADAWTMLLNMPPAMLYCGFVKYPIPRSPKVWMRTHGGNLLGVPDLALLADTYQQGEKAFNLFNAVINHVHNTQANLASGQTLQVTPDLLLRFRQPAPHEIVLESPGQLLVIEPQSAGTQPAVVSI
jgi:hypothetical protein